MKSEEIINLENEFIISTYRRLPVVFVKGEGVTVWDAEGKSYLDFVSGLAVNGLGHCHPQVTAAICQQARKLVHTSNLYYTEPQARLAQKLAQLTGGMKSFFCNSGAEANEAAIKLTRKYAKANLGADKYEIIAAFNSFHGRTLATITATGQEKYKRGFEPLMPGFFHVPFNDFEDLEKNISHKTCAIILEPIQGEGGVYVADKEYLQRVRQLCDERKLLLLLDEVQTGMGRTGKMFAYEHYDIKPDILTLAKSIASGLPMGVMLAKPEIATAFQPGDHAATFGGNPLACRAALATLEILEKEHLIENARAIGEYFLKKLQELQSKYEFISEVRGLGLMLALELKLPEAKKIQEECLRKGAIVNAIGDNTIRFLPPLIVKKEHVDKVIDLLDEVFTIMAKQD